MFDVIRGAMSSAADVVGRPETDQCDLEQTNPPVFPVVAVVSNASHSPPINEKKLGVVTDAALSHFGSR